MEQLAERIRDADQKYIELFSNSGQTIQELQKRSDELEEVYRDLQIQSTTGEAPPNKEEWLKEIGYTEDVVPSSK